LGGLVKLIDFMRCRLRRLRVETLKQFVAVEARGLRFSMSNRNRDVVAVLVAIGLLTACNNTLPTRGRPGPVDPKSVATIVVRHADGTPAHGAEVALAESGDWTRVGPVRGRTDAEGRVVLRCVSPCVVRAWTRQPPAVWQEPSIDFSTYVMPGSSSELRLTPVAFAALAVQPASPCYATLHGYGSHPPLSPLPGLLPHRPDAHDGWRYVVTASPDVAAAPLELWLAAAGRATTTVVLTPGPARDCSPVVVDLASLAPRPWAAPRLEVALPNGELFGEAATELVRSAIWLYDETAGEVFFAGDVRNGVPGRIHVPAGRFVVRMNLLGELTECWSGQIAADTNTLRMVLPKDLRPVEVTLRGLLAWPVNLVVQVNGTVRRAGDAPSTLFDLDPRGLGDSAIDAETTRLVLMVPPGDLTIALQEGNEPHRPIGGPQPIRVDTALAATPARVTMDVPPR
jgi:hypothetical protein